MPDTAPLPPGATLAILCLIATVGLAGSFLYLPALPLMAAGFNASEPAAQATLTAFLLGSCVGFALYGRAAERFGHRLSFTLAGAVFVAASLAAAMTTDIAQLVAARLVQGAGSVAGIVTARATIRIIMPPERAVQAMAMLTAVVSLSPAVSPLIGAGVLQLADWRATFVVAAGLGLSFTQDDLVIDGHAIEVRINAEKLPNFAPCPGQVRTFHAPGGLGVRMDSALYGGYRIPPYYDSLVAKLIVHGRDRPEALARLRRALGELIIDGIDTTVPLFFALLEERDILAGDYNIHWLEKFLAEKLEQGRE